MSKRAIDHEDVAEKSAKTESNTNPISSGQTNVGANADDVEMGEFEDPYGDDFESEGEIIEIDSAGEEEDGEAGDVEQQQLELVLKLEAEQEEPEETIYLPHKSRPLGPDEVLEADPSVYQMLHNVHLPWPCMTLDILPDNLGNERRGFPASLYLATLTQASKAKDNELIVMKLSSLAKTLVKDEDEDDDDEDEDDDVDVDPILENENIPLRDTTNRLRVSPHAQQTGEYFTLTMSENGDCYIHDLSHHYKAFDTPGYTIPKPFNKPIHTIKAHGNVEGYGLDWSPLITTGSVLTGDCSGRVYLTQRTLKKWVTDSTPFQASSASVEDIQWSPSEQTVFATGDCDGYIRIWDTRSKKHKPAINVKASGSDVNVISWCNKLDYLLASGHDDGTWGVWDLRNFKNNQVPSPVVHYDFHKAPITSIKFNPLDDSIIAVSSEDNTVTLWDLAVEADDEEVKQQQNEFRELNDIPPQLLFVHWQKEVKDVAWHKQIPGALVSTGTDGLNVWKTISVD